MAGCMCRVLCAVCAVCFAGHELFVAPRGCRGARRDARDVARRAQILPALQPREEKTRKIYRLKPLGSNSDQAPMLNYVEKNMLN